jgi:hypothetical protein
MAHATEKRLLVVVVASDGDSEQLELARETSTTELDFGTLVRSALEHIVTAVDRVEIGCVGEFSGTEPTLELDGQLLQRIAQLHGALNLNLQLADSNRLRNEVAHRAVVPDTRCSFGFYGHDFDPNVLTKVLKATPSLTARVGDQIGKGRARARRDVWEWSSRSHRSLTFEPAFYELREMIEGQEAALRDAAGLSRAKPMVSFNADYVDAIPSLDLSASAIRLLADLRATVVLDLVSRERLEEQAISH